jgi:hypothetical protein
MKMLHAILRPIPALLVLPLLLLHPDPVPGHRASIGEGSRERPAVPAARADTTSAAGDFTLSPDGLPLYIVENAGQVSAEATHYVKGHDCTVFFRRSGLTFVLSAPDEPGTWRVDMEFIEPCGDSYPRGEEPAPAVFSYFRGTHDRWVCGARSYRRIVYTDVWPGIDFVCIGARGRLKYEFVVRPEGDLERIRLAYSGMSTLEIDESGALVASTPFGNLVDEAPFAYQTAVDGDRTEVRAAYTLEAENGVHDAAEVRFEVGEHDPGRVLVIDPAMLIYCGYIGGAGWDSARSIVVDEDGYAYVTGQSKSSEATFPVAVGPDVEWEGNNDVFVAKVSRTGSHLLFCGYIGGRNSDVGRGIGLDQERNIYVAGHTTSSEQAGFPVLVGPNLHLEGTRGEAFVAKVHASGTGLEYCGYIGGTGEEYASGIAVAPDGTAFVAGGTTSSEADGFPVRIGPDVTFNGEGPEMGDAFVARVAPDGSELEYCGYIGGSDSDVALSVAIDAAGSAYVTGGTSSTEASFPVVVGPDLEYNGDDGELGDAFVAKVKADGTGFDYCGYIGGDRKDQGFGIAVDDQGCAYVIGVTRSDEGTFPVVVGPDLTYNDGDDHEEDSFVAKVAPGGSFLEYCGYVGGAAREWSGHVAVDAKGHAYLVGATRSDQGSFPVFEGPDSSYNSGAVDAYVAKVAVDGSGLVYSGFVGGTRFDILYAVTVDAEGNTFVAGGTASSESNGFPIVVGPDLGYNDPPGFGQEERGDAFVAKLPPFFPCSRGTVDLGSGGEPVSVLLVNGEDGSPWRTVTVSVGEPLTVEMTAPPAGPDPAPFALYLWRREPRLSTIRPQPFRLGEMCLPGPIDGDWPAPYKIWNNIGYRETLGHPDFPSTPAPSVVANRPFGMTHIVTVTLQGFIFDNGSAADGPASVTNSVSVRIVP